jgi:tetratricopeptide (TPR) repeat protein
MISRLICFSLAMLLPGFASAAGSPSASLGECEGAKADASLVSVDFDGRADDLLGKLIRFKRLEVANSELVGIASIIYKLPCVSVNFLMRSLADESGLQAVHLADTRFRLTRISNFAAINKLRKEADAARRDDSKKLTEILRRIVALSQAGNSNESPASAEEAFHELGNLAMGDKDYVEAERWYRARVSDLDRIGAMHDSDYGIAVSNIADALAYQDDYARATPIYERALAVLEKQNDLGAPANAVLILETLSNAAVGAKRFDEAESLAQRAWKTLGDPHRSQWEGVKRALEIAADAETEFANLGPKGRSGVHLERALELLEARYPTESPELIEMRHRVMMSAAQSGNFNRATEVAEQQLAAADQRGERKSDAYVSVLYELLALYADQETLDKAIGIWPRLIEVRQALLGNNSPNVVAGLHQLAALYRINGQWDEAEATDQRANAIKPVDDSEVLAGLQLDSSFAMRFDPVLPLFCSRFELKSTDLGSPMLPPLLPPPLPPVPSGVYFALQTSPRTMPTDKLAQARYFEQIAECFSDSQSYAGTAMERALRLHIALNGVDGGEARHAAERAIDFYQQGQNTRGVERVRALSSD